MTGMTTMRAVLLVLALSTSAAISACASNARGPNDPLSPAAQAIRVVGTADPACKKIGTAHGKGRDLVDKVAENQALDGAREQAVKLAGNTIVVSAQTSEPEAGQGGTYHVVTKTADVYKCP